MTWRGELDAVVEWSDVLRRYLLVSPELTMTLNWNHLAPVERAERLTGAWDGEWFAEDYCEGPGQALIVTPRGEVKPCCGFASDLDQLTIGNIYKDSVRTIIRRARKHPYVGKVFREGLTAIRDEILRATRRRCRRPRRITAFSVGTFSPKAFSIGRARTPRIGWVTAAVRGRESGWPCRWPAQACRAARGAVASEVESGRPGGLAVKDHSDETEGLFDDFRACLDAMTGAGVSQSLPPMTRPSRQRADGVFDAPTRLFPCGGPGDSLI